MTDEELEREIQKLDENIKRLTNSKEPLSKVENRRKYAFMMMKDTLKRVKEARAKNRTHQEYQGLAMYALLDEWKDRHPILLQMARVRMGLHSWNF
ncbi:hypothetical protein ACFLV3_04255 [Chloroflexota bacterium]